MENTFVLSEHFWGILLLLLSSFGVSVIFCRWILPILKRKKIGQHIMDDTITEHKDKEGTPTMGGIAFVLAFLVLMLPLVILLRVKEYSGIQMLAFTVCLGVANAIIGFLDDYVKLTKGRNKGLQWWQKLTLQVVVAVLYVIGVQSACGGDCVFDFGLLGWHWDLGIFYYPVVVLIIVGIVNAANLTDGMDGLASTLCITAAGALLLIAIIQKNVVCIAASAILIGCITGFLPFNYHPARMFMGDTGSLFIGSMLVGIGFMLQAALPTVLSCGVFILEMLTSLIQMIAIRGFHHRVFPIAPIHHAFQRAHWSEEKVVYVFNGVAQFFALAAVILAFIG